MKTFLIRFLPPLLWMWIIFRISSLNTLPGPQTGEVIWWDFILKKMAHMAEYSILFYLWQRGINWNKPKPQRAYWSSALIVLMYAVSDEWHQSLSPGRHPRVYDVGFDMLGSFLAYIKLKRFV